MARVRAACSERGGVLSDSVAGLPCADCGRGVVEACVARSCSTSSRMEGRSGCLFDRSEGGAVTLMAVLKARRNWRAERLSGNTCTS